MKFLQKSDMHMILEHKLNKDLSEEIYKSCKRWIKPKQCYSNVFHVTTNFVSNFSNGIWKIAYGYMKISAYNLMTRHCFIVNKKNEAIDPTIYSLKTFKEDNEHKYISFAVLNYDEYVDMIINNDNNPSLTIPLSNKERLAMEWAKNNNLFLIG
jgi:hypothetical protein